MKITRMLPAVAIATAAALVLGACGQPTEKQAPISGGQSQSGAATSATGKPAAGTKACMIAGPEGFEDKGVNEGGKAGLTRAEKELGVKIRTEQVASEAVVAAGIQELVVDGCTVILGAGEPMASPMDTAAKENPDVKFVLIDATLPKHPKNARSILFDTPEAAFLAGYAAAAMTPTGKVGTFVNAEEPEDARLAAGFAGGVSEYNEVHGKAIEIVDWDEQQLEGPSIDAKTAEGATAAGLKQAEELIAAGAGIILPPAGPAGVATLDKAKTHGETWVVWPGSDGAITQPEYANLILTSVMKNVDNAVFETIEAVTQGNFNSTPYIGNLENGGVGLSSWHKFDGLVPAAAKTEIDRLRQDIVAGKVSVPTLTPLD